MLTKLGSKFLFATSCSHAKSWFEGIVDPPLKTSQCTNHDDTGTETLEKANDNR